MDVEIDHPMNPRVTPRTTAAPTLPSRMFPTRHLASEPPPAAPDKDGEDDEEDSPDRDEDFDRVDEASEESFPASDPPGFTPLHIGS